MVVSRNSTGALTSCIDSWHLEWVSFRVGHKLRGRPLTMKSVVILLDAIVSIWRACRIIRMRISYAYRVLWHAEDGRVIFSVRSVRRGFLFRFMRASSFGTPHGWLRYLKITSYAWYLQNHYGNAANDTPSCYGYGRIHTRWRPLDSTPKCVEVTLWLFNTACICVFDWILIFLVF